MHRIFDSLFTSSVRVVWRFVLLGNIAAGDAIVLQTEMAPSGVFMKMRFEIIKWQVPADVAVKFAIDIASRVAYFRAPYLLAGLDVPCKHGHAIWTGDRRINAISRARIAVKDRVCITDKILD